MYWLDSIMACLQVHRGCLLVTLGCTVVGFIIIFVHRMGYSTVSNTLHTWCPPLSSHCTHPPLWLLQMPDLPDKAHPPLGITVTILCVLNVSHAVLFGSLCRTLYLHHSSPHSRWLPCAAPAPSPSGDLCSTGSIGSLDLLPWCWQVSSRSLLADPVPRV